MNNQRIVAGYSIAVGLMIIGLWVMLISTGQVPYLDTPQMEIKLHIVTEIITALMLIIGGVSILKGWSLKRKFPYIALGMLLYSILNSSGYYIDLGETGMAAMFAVLLFCTVAALLSYSGE